ncbi:uncharacterized protein LOC109517061 isoform X1 [Hippocampus comes]|uniref:uncharacterized protein LOC109517061 isoform X1 n=1 Tax=Hippocampus comes TaxID=109280 RepID=UPI00094E2CA8|nr:PREDICTED: uncharacterized protein LOC109517061 isoform X1 [Hippocampus comes]
MNLYRSFGNLMEAWVAEQHPDPELLEDISKDSPSRSSHSYSALEKNVRTESVDSGVETASTDTFFPTSSLSMDMAETDSFASGPGNDNHIPFSSDGSASLPPYLSPPALSQPTNLRRVQGSVVFNQKLRQALQRSESRQVPEPHAIDQRDHTASRRRTSILRSESFGSWETARPSVPAWQISGVRKQILSSGRKMGPMQLKSEDVRNQSADMTSHPQAVEVMEGKIQQAPPEVFSTGLSPGLRYLEQVCQKWEDVAKQQLVNGGSNVDRARASSSCQSLEQTHEPLTFYKVRLESLSDKDKQLKEIPEYFRQRSASETTVSSTQPREFSAGKFKPGSRGQQSSTFNLRDKEAQSNKMQGDFANVSTKNRKIKLLSLKKDEPSLQNTNSQPMQSFERNAARRQLSQLFRRRWKTLPVHTTH